MKATGDYTKYFNILVILEIFLFSGKHRSSEGINGIILEACYCFYKKTTGMVGEVIRSIKC